jgi:hypothetical protein
VRLKIQHHILLFLTLLSLAFRVFAQSDSEVTARLFKRYEHGASGHRTGEDVLTLTLSLTRKDRAMVAVRVCSKEPLAFALVTAGADPFQIAELVAGGPDYSPEQVMFLRADNCLSKYPSATATEIWAIPERASLPPHVEAFKSNEVKLITLGKRPANRGVRDYRSAVGEMINTLRADSASRGVVFGYFLERPSPMLRRRLREVRKMLRQSGLPSDRYLVRSMGWNDEVSTYPPDSEPVYPSLFVVEIARTAAKR